MWQCLEITSKDGDEGYPGALLAQCEYALSATALCITLTAPSPVNLLHHSYFNLEGSTRIDQHHLRIDAKRFVEFDDEGLPTGTIPPVAGTRQDFRTLRRIGQQAGFETSFVLPGRLSPWPRLAATLVSGAEDLAMDVHTTEPGLHFYSGFSAAATVPLQDVRPCLAEPGLCLEATRFNDATNFAQFADVITRPGKPYVQRTEFHFRAPSAET